jgi:cytochrome c5
MANGEWRMEKGLAGFLSLVPCLLSLGAMPAAAATPTEQYVTYCALCHMPGIHGAPKVGDREDWARRVRPGMLMIYRNVIEGMPNTAMLAMGGAPLSAAEVKAIADYMVAAAGLPASALKDAARYDKLGITDRDFVRRDVNYDGFLSRGELAGDAVLLKNLARFDENRDGRLSEAEYVKGEAALARERAEVQVDDVVIEAAVRKALAGVKAEVGRMK